jgi:stage V sporulation protein S
MGARAVNQAVKATIIARGYLELDGIDVICIPSLVVLEIDGQEYKATVWSIEPR